VISKIVAIQLKGTAGLIEKQGYLFEIKPNVIDYLTDHGYDAEYGARPLKRLVQREITNLISKKIIAGEFYKGDKIIVDVIDDVIVIYKG
jgi:ATP-dependent Clp protease ATP-binding subunit ClpB